MRVSTPEGIDLDLPLAGLGSRVAAAIVDVSIMGVLIIVVSYLGARISADLGGGGWVAATVGVLVFVIVYGYGVAFETLNSGRTPGKLINGLRVVRTDGRPITFRASAVRNLLWWVDGPVTFLLAGSIAILATPRNQRLGDLAAGTIVARDRRPAPEAGLGTQDLFPLPSSVATWDASSVTPEELAAVRSFLERRHTLPSANRERLGLELATRLAPKIVGAAGRMHPEAFLECIRAAKTARDDRSV